MTFLINQIWTALNSSQSVDEEIINWDNVINTDFLTPEERLSTITARIANLTVEISQSTPFQTDAETRLLISKASEIENDLVIWSASLDSSWCPIVVTGPNCIPSSVRATGLYQEHCEIYPSLSVATTWNRYRLATIRLQSAISKLQPDQALPQQIIQHAIDDVCASVPYHLGDRTRRGVIGDKSIKYPHDEGQQVPESHYNLASAVGGFSLLEPLRTVLGIGVKMRDGQRQWIMGQMGRIKKVYDSLF